jgi:S1-C subfamily serine protease
VRSRPSIRLNPEVIHKSAESIDPVNSIPKACGLFPVWVTVGVLNLCIICTALYVAGVFRSPYSVAKLPPLTAKSAAAGAQQAKAESMSTREIVERAEGSVAQIRGLTGIGTGFLVGKQLLATNAHVVQFDLARDLRVLFPSGPTVSRGPYAVHIFYEDPKRDLALLSVDSGLPPLELARSYVFQRGDDITILGNPGLGGEISLQNAITRGVMSTEATVLPAWRIGQSGQLRRPSAQYGGQGDRDRLLQGEERGGCRLLYTS